METNAAIWKSASFVCRQQAEPGLRFHISPVGGLVEPAQRFGMILWHAVAAVVQQAENPLRCRISLVGGLAVPPRRLGVVPRHALAVVVHHAEIILRSCIP